MKRIITLTLVTIALAACGSNGLKAADKPVAEPAVQKNTTTTEAEVETTEVEATTTTEAKPKPVKVVTCGVGEHSIGKTCVKDADVAPATTAPPAPKAGTRTNPLSGTALTSESLETATITGLAPGDWGAIVAANRYNDPAPEGQFYAKLTYTATAKADIIEPLGYYEVTCDLVGSKGKVYNQASLSDVDGNLHLLNDQSDIIGGGTMTGDVYYLVDLDDTGLLALCGDVYVLPA